MSWEHMIAAKRKTAECFMLENVLNDDVNTFMGKNIGWNCQLITKWISW